MVLSDSLILKRILEEGMLEDATLLQLEQGVISSGVSCAGYDLTLDYTIKVAKVNNHRGLSVYHKDNIPPYVIDAKRPNPDMFREIHLHKGEVLVLYPGEYFIGNSIETFHMPNDLVGVVLGKSTYARSLVVINCTPVEAGWEGSLAIEGANIGTLPVAIYPGEGICQVLFFEIRGEVLKTYADKKGKYQDQAKGDTLSKVK